MNIVAHNLTAMNAMRQYNLTIDSKRKSTEKLSSGYRVNRAADDAAGLAISEKMRTQIRGLNRGATNIQDGISLVQVADGALSTIHDILHRMNELATQAANDTNTNIDREAIQKELGSLSEEINRIGRDTTFNTMHILDDINSDGSDGSITSLVTCPSADVGYLSESIPVRSGFMSSATVDFSNINESNIGKLNGQGFSFNCSRGCDEVFDFKFTTDGTPSSADNLKDRVKHYYSLDISNCKTGEDVINELFNYVGANLPYDNEVDREKDNPNILPGSLLVSHSNCMIKTDDGNGLIVYSNTSIAADGTFVRAVYPTREAAESVYLKNNPLIDPKSGKIECTDLTNLY